MSGVRIPSGTFVLLIKGTYFNRSGLFDRTAGDSFTAIGLWWVWRSWLARQIVALEALGSSPSTHPLRAIAKR